MFVVVTLACSTTSDKTLDNPPESKFNRPQQKTWELEPMVVFDKNLGCSTARHEMNGAGCDAGGLLGDLAVWSARNISGVARKY